MGSAWPKSGFIERDDNDNPAPGAEAEFFEGGTTTPLPVFQDAAETTPHTDPVVADANGRWPLIIIPFIASYDVKVSTTGGTQLYYHRELPNADPVEASEDSVDENKIRKTGEIFFDPKTGTKSGNVRCNGRTVGSASSGATERANADTEDLYTYNWNNFADAILAVTTGRGASAAADFAANKAMALFDVRAGGLRGVDDMGNSAASRLGSTPFTSGNATTGGSICGLNTHTLVTGELAAHTHGAGSYAGDSGGAHTHTGTTDSGGGHTHTATTSSDGAHTHGPSGGGAFAVLGAAGATWATPAGGTQNQASATSSDGAHTHTLTTTSDGAHTHTFTTASGGSHTHTISGTSASTGSGTAHNNVARDLLGTFFQVL